MTSLRARLKRLGALPLVAALAVGQICPDLGAFSANAAPMEATLSSGGCCDPSLGSACAPDPESNRAFDNCARHCVQGTDAPQFLAGLPAAKLAFHGPAPAARVATPSRYPKLGVAPRALINTPLIYRFQRLLN